LFKHLEIVERIKPLLAGHAPERQGAGLADLLSIWLAGHPAFLREELLIMHIEQGRKLVPISEAETAERFGRTLG
jgi:hypothetical protein